MPGRSVGGNLLATEEVPAEKTASYGVIAPGETDGALTEVLGMVENPTQGSAVASSGSSAATFSSPR